MSYIENIRKNVSDAIQVGKIAITGRINYKVAKIMYHNGRNDIDEITARGILKELEGNNIPLDLMDDLDILNSYYKQDRKLALEDIYRGISKYANRKYISELSNYIWADYNYGKAIHDLMKSGSSIDKAIKIFEKKVSSEIKESGLSEFAAITKLLFFKSDLGAIEFEKSYKEGKAIKNNPFATVKERLFTSDEYKKKKVHGIMLISRTENGLKNLEYLVNLAFRMGNQQFLSQLSLQGENNYLSITDFVFDKHNKVSYYATCYKNICLLPKKSTEEALSTFFHETTHFLDNVRSHENTNSFSSVNDPVIKELLEIIKAKGFITLRGLSINLLSNTNVHQYVHNPILKQKWLSEIQHENPSATPEELRLFYQQKIMYERKKYKVLIGCLSDIYDGLTQGKILKYGGIGHGKKYYSNSNMVPIEFIAEIGSFYNYGGIDVLNHELGPDLTQKLVTMYQSFIRLNPETNNNLNEQNEETKNAIKR